MCTNCWLLFIGKRQIIEVVGVNRLFHRQDTNACLFELWFSPSRGSEALNATSACKIANGWMDALSRFTSDAVINQWSITQLHKLQSAWESTSAGKTAIPRFYLRSSQHSQLRLTTIICQIIFPNGLKLLQLNYMCKIVNMKVVH